MGLDQGGGGGGGASNLSDLSDVDDVVAPTKGSLLVPDGTSWVEVPVGSDGQIPQADSSQTAGIRWVSGAAALDAAVDFIATNESTSSTSFTDLATPGPEVAVTVGATGLLLVSVSAQLINSTASQWAGMSFELSGANTLAASLDHVLLMSRATESTAYHGAWVGIIDGLSAGATTVTAKYRVSGGSGQFIRRRLSAIAL